MLGNKQLKLRRQPQSFHDNEEQNDHFFTKIKNQKGNYQQNNDKHSQTFFHNDGKMSRNNRIWKSVQENKNQSVIKSQHNHINYERPIHLLKTYLVRKQRLTFMPILSRNIQIPSQRPNEYNKTTNQFRIKKSKRGLSINPKQQIRLQGRLRPNKQAQFDEDFINFNTSKNIYQMSHEQLQESIRWKKHFLELLNKKIHNCKNYSKLH